MAEFLVEHYVPRTGSQSVAASAESARCAAEELTREGTPVRYLRSIFVPEDEVCFYLFEAHTAESVAEVARRAEIPIERVARAIQSTCWRE